MLRDAATLQWPMEGLISPPESVCSLRREGNEEEAGRYIKVVGRRTPPVSFWEIPRSLPFHWIIVRFRQIS